jgi:ribonucleoside-diphosphate reductase alpha chain
MASAELPAKQEKYTEKFYDELVNNRFIAGGRILYGAGRPTPNLLNCFVLENQLDSKEGWGEIARQMIITSMSGGGCGIDFSDVRPRGAEINGHRGSAPGSVELMKLINNSGDPIKAGGVRRVALMFSLDLDHPDIEEFLDAKIGDGSLTMANISVRLREPKKFIEAVETDGDWELSWKGKYKKTIKAKKLWEKIVSNAYDHADPGVLNHGLALDESTIYYLKELVTTNPCGEIWLSVGESCDLGHLVLPRFVKEDKSVDWELMGESIRMLVRFLDNVLSVNKYPLPMMEKVGQELRRIGLGVTGLADMLALMDIKYGSEDGNKFVDRLFRFISKMAYESSVMLAIEKGMFEGCDPEKHVKSGYVKRMTPKIKALILEHGIRNCALLTIAPTGTTSILSNNCSSGIEPMFAPTYMRRFYSGENKDVKEEELCFHPLFKEFMDQGRSVDHFVGSADLSVEDHMKVQAVIQKHIDNAVSKTINMPKDYSKEDMSEMWLKYMPVLKGTTFFRTGAKKFKNSVTGEMEDAPLRPIPVQEALDLLNKSNEVVVEAADSEEACRNGVCEV